MAFMGILFVSMAAMIFFFVIIVTLILAVFVPCLIISIVNLVKAAKRGWPKRYVIPMAITGSIVLLFILLFIYIGISAATSSSSANTSSSVQSAQYLIQAYLPLL